MQPRVCIAVDQVCPEKVNNHILQVGLEGKSKRASFIIVHDLQVTSDADYPK